MQTAFDRGPGLYWQDDVRPSTGDVASGIPALVGYTLSADPNSAISVTAVVRSDDVSGVVAELGCDFYLQFAVRGFFQNGGKKCLIALFPNTWEKLADYTEKVRLVNDGLHLALNALESQESMDLVAAPFIPGLVSSGFTAAHLLTLQTQLLKFCQDRGDCFAILDSSPGIGDLSRLGTYASALAAHEASHNGALYYPWIKVAGGCPVCNGMGRSERSNDCSDCKGTGAVSVPPSGHIAGIYARVDQRVGVYRAPANEPIEGIIDLDHTLFEADVGTYSSTMANVLRPMAGRGLRVWGACTLSRKSEWRWISVRRLFLSVSRWLQSSLSNVVFEPNDIRLWMRIDREVTSYLDALYRQGALKGTTSSDAYYVRCNAETNPASVRENGQVVVELGIAPTIPREFIVLRMLRASDSVSVE